MEDARRLAELPLHHDPVTEIVTHVIAAERQHRHRVAAYLADGAAGCGGRLGAHGGADIDTARPIEGLEHQRNRARTAAAEDDRADRHAGGVLPVGIDARALPRWRREARVGMRRLPTATGHPLLALPVDRPGGRLVRHAFPPRPAVGREGHVGEDRVLRQRGHGVGIGLRAGAGRHAEEARLGVDGVEAAIRAGFDPRDVVAHGPHLPALEGLRRDQHGKIGLAARAWKRRRHMGLLALRVLNAKDEHVLGHPALVARDVGGDAQGEALLAQQRVAAVAGAVGPDLARLGKMHDVFLVRVAGPGHVPPALRQRRADRMHAGHDALVALVNQREHRPSNARHDAHVGHDIARIRQLHPDPRHGRVQRTHAEGQHIHRAPLHAAAEQAAQGLLHLEGVHPVIGGTGVVLREAANKRPVLNARHVAGIGAHQETSGPFLLVQADEGARRDQLPAQGVVFLLGSVDPVDMGGLAESHHLPHPGYQMGVGAERSFQIPCFHWRRHARKRLPSSKQEITGKSGKPNSSHDFGWIFLRAVLASGFPRP